MSSKLRQQIKEQSEDLEMQNWLKSRQEKEALNINNKKEQNSNSNLTPVSIY